MLGGFVMKNQIEKRILKGELSYKNTVILTYQIEYPQMIYSMYKEGKEIFNYHNRKKAMELEQYVKTDLYENAKELYEYNVANGYPVMVYEVIAEYTITYNEDFIVSLYQDEYQFTGGAHGNTIRSSQNWDLRVGKRLPLCYFYPKNPYYVIDILKQINSQIKKQIEEGINQYFENYCELVLETFRLDSYYVVPNGIVIYFQQYDIAPYSSGIPIFFIIK